MFAIACLHPSRYMTVAIMLCLLQLCSFFIVLAPILVIGGLFLIPIFHCNREAVNQKFA